MWNIILKNDTNKLMYLYIIQMQKTETDFQKQTYDY